MVNVLVIPYSAVFAMMSSSIYGVTVAVALLGLWVVWFFVDLFRIPSLTRETNEQIAIEKVKNKVYL